MIRADWEDYVVYELSQELGVSRAVAQDQFENNVFAVAQTWGKGLYPDAAAKHIVAAL